MQSIATVTPIGFSRDSEYEDKKGGAGALRHAPPPVFQDADLFALGLGNLLATVETVRADVVTQMNLTRRGFNSQSRRGQEIVRTMHATLGRGLLVLLDSHEKLLIQKRYLIRTSF
jgi:hypothetical protein